MIRNFNTPLPGKYQSFDDLPEHWQYLIGLHLQVLGERYEFIALHVGIGGNHQIHIRDTETDEIGAFQNSRLVEFFGYLNQQVSLEEIQSFPDLLANIKATILEINEEHNTSYNMGAFDHATITNLFGHLKLTIWFNEPTTGYSLVVFVDFDSQNVENYQLFDGSFWGNILP